MLLIVGSYQFKFDYIDNAARYARFPPVIDSFNEFDLPGNNTYLNSITDDIFNDHIYKYNNIFENSSNGFDNEDNSPIIQSSEWIKQLKEIYTYVHRMTKNFDIKKISQDRISDTVNVFLPSFISYINKNETLDDKVLEEIINNLLEKQNDNSAESVVICDNSTYIR